MFQSLKGEDNNTVNNTITYSGSFWRKKNKTTTFLSCISLFAYTPSTNHKHMVAGDTSGEGAHKANDWAPAPSPAGVERSTRGYVTAHAPSGRSASMAPSPWTARSNSRAGP